MGKVELRDAFPGYRQAGNRPLERGVWNTAGRLNVALISTSRIRCAVRRAA
jgi:hypothetical protein